MIEVAFSSEFAEVSFWAKGENLAGTGRVVDVSPEPKPTLRLDWRRYGKLILNCEAGSFFEVGLDYTTANGWTANEEGGEAFMCSLFEHHDGHQAAIGLRDYDWNAEHLALAIVNSALLPAKSWAKYKANSSADLEFEISLALTKSPIDDVEGLSPWLYVDQALKF